MRFDPLYRTFAWQRRHSVRTPDEVQKPEVAEVIHAAIKFFLVADYTVRNINELSAARKIIRAAARFFLERDHQLQCELFGWPLHLLPND